MDEVSIRAAGTMMHSAFFGQIIILIVFTPILFLTGVSGKMFQPMAFTFSFALIGAILLCLTYVPMISSVLMRPSGGRLRWLSRAEERLGQFSQRLMNGIYRAYHPALRFAMRHKVPSIVASLLLLGGSGVVLSRMGGEFIPSLDEGDIAMQTFLRPQFAQRDHQARGGSGTAPAEVVS